MNVSVHITSWSLKCCFSCLLFTGDSSTVVIFSRVLLDMLASFWSNDAGVLPKNVAGKLSLSVDLRQWICGSPIPEVGCDNSLRNFQFGHKYHFSLLQKQLWKGWEVIPLRVTLLWTEEKFKGMKGKEPAWSEDTGMSLDWKPLPLTVLKYIHSDLFVCSQSCCLRTVNPCPSHQRTVSISSQSRCLY